MLGCVAPPIVPIDRTLDDPNSSILYISRAAKYVGGGVGYRIFVNGDYIGELWGGGAISRPVQPGPTLVEFKPYSFGIPGVGAKELELILDVGYRYHISLDANLDGIIPVGSTVAVSGSTSINVTKDKIGHK